jgi:histidinol-phosphate aminotransferase
MISRRSFFKTAGMAATATVAASAGFPPDLLAWAEPRRVQQTGGPLLLNSNENAYGPFPSVAALPNPFRDANRYPDNNVGTVVNRLAKLHNVTPDHIVLGCGSTEILKISACAFTGPERKLVTASPTFEAIESYARAVKASVAKLPLTSTYSHPLPAMQAESKKDTGLVYVCNPNNPTGTLTTRRTIENFVRELPKGVHVLIDEAYHDFVPVSADYISFADHPVDIDRVIVARTFSKIYGLAGLRIGYAVTSPATAKVIAAQKQEDSANIFALRCALASLDDQDERELAIQRNAMDREAFMREAAKRKLQTLPSWTNFVMFNTLRPVRPVIEYFEKNNIRIGRPFPPMETYARISLGTPEQMKQFWRVWDTLPAAE